MWQQASNAECARAYGTDWKIWNLMADSTWMPQNCVLFPRTIRALFASGAAREANEIFFARQPAATGLLPHTDNLNFVLGAHLGLDVPTAPHARAAIGYTHTGYRARPGALRGSGHR